MAILENVRDAAQKRLLFLPHAIRQMSRPLRMISSNEVEAVVTRGEVIEETSLKREKSSAAWNFLFWKFTNPQRGKRSGYSIQT
jgi:hypothetical protein